MKIYLLPFATLLCFHKRLQIVVKPFVECLLLNYYIIIIKYSMTHFLKQSCNLFFNNCPQEFIAKQKIAFDVLVYLFYFT